METILHALCYLFKLRMDQWSIMGIFGPKIEVILLIISLDFGATHKFFIYYNAFMFSLLYKALHFSRFSLVKAAIS